jgi:hypothetical protein
VAFASARLSQRKKLMVQIRFRAHERAAVQAPKAMALTLKYKEAQEHLLRRLGQAVVQQWEELPNILQDVLIDQAAIVVDRDEAAHGVNEFETFIRKVRSVPRPS